MPAQVEHSENPAYSLSVNKFQLKISPTEISKETFTQHDSDLLEHTKGKVQ